jgi:hypothetical protein
VTPPLPVCGDCYRAAPKRLTTAWVIACDAHDAQAVKKAKNFLRGFAVKRQRRTVRSGKRGA